MKYEEAIKELEKIVNQIESDEMDIDNISENIKKAQEIIKICKEKLTKAEDDIKAITDVE